MKIRVRRVLFGAAILLLGSALLFLLTFTIGRGSTPPIVDASGQPIPQSIAELEKIRIGGVEQYVLIRGHNRAKPVLLFLHGGPGMPAMYLAHAFQRELEREFVVVHWDRRGAGKSYGALGPADTPTVRQTLDDTYELTALLRERFRQERIYLVGHSWGSYLGVLAVHERPEWYHAYIGTGQVAGDTARVFALQRQFVLRHAAARGDSAVVTRMEAGNRPTEDDLFRYGGELHDATTYWPILRTGLQAQEYTLSDIMNVQRGAQRVGRLMKNDVSDLPLEQLVRRIEIPVFLFLGRHDFATPSALAEEYLEGLSAPEKGVIWFEQSAHFPFFEEPEHFVAALRDVRSTVESRSDSLALDATGS